MTITTLPFSECVRNRFRTDGGGRRAGEGLCRDPKKNRPQLAPATTGSGHTELQPLGNSPPLTSKSKLTGQGLKELTLVEVMGIEPTASTLRTSRSAN